MTVARLALLGVGVVTVLVRPRAWPAWLGPAAAVVVGLATGVLSPGGVGDAVRPLASPLAFLLLAVPLALLLDEAGFFAAIAARIDGSRHLPLGLWLFAAGVTTLFNLDAAVVLLTPLYVRLARRHGMDPLAAAFPPVLLACFASSALPVSNLTNLLAAERFELGAADFLLRLGPASAAAVVVGYVAYRRALPLRPTVARLSVAVEPGALLLGAPVVAFVLVGFTVGDHLGVPAWAVAGLADAYLMVRRKRVPWRELPVGAAALAAALAVLAAAAAPDLGVDRLLGGDGVVGSLRTMAVGVVGANLLNNLPALLVALPVVDGAGDDRLWAVLAAVNLGPVLAVTGSLAGLLWLDTVRRLGVEVDARTYTRIGLRVGLPALAAATAVVVATAAVTG